MVTTGLKCAPLIGPNVEISATSPAPVAMVLANSAIATFPAASRSSMMPEPTTVASRNAVPTASLVAFLITIAPEALNRTCLSLRQREPHGERRLRATHAKFPRLRDRRGQRRTLHGDKASPFEKMRRRRRQQEKLTQLACSRGRSDGIDELGSEPCVARRQLHGHASQQTQLAVPFQPGTAHE